MRLVQLFVAAVFVAASSSASNAQTLEFEPPAVGTKFFNNANGYFEITGVKGKSVTAKDAKGIGGTWYGMFVPRSAAGAMDEYYKADEIWPLEPGKKIAFNVTSRSVGGTDQRYRNEITVLGVEEIEILGRRINTYKVQRLLTNIDSGGGRFERWVYWYSPEHKFQIRVDYDNNYPPPNANKPYRNSLTRVELPGKP